MELECCYQAPVMVLLNLEQGSELVFLDKAQSLQHHQEFNVFLFKQ